MFKSASAQAIMLVDLFVALHNLKSNAKDWQELHKLISNKDCKIKKKRK
jgi:hypothetical protein